MHFYRWSAKYPSNAIRAFINTTGTALLVILISLSTISTAFAADQNSPISTGALNDSNSSIDPNANQAQPASDDSVNDQSIDSSSTTSSNSEAGETDPNDNASNEGVTENSCADVADSGDGTFDQGSNEDASVYESLTNSLSGIEATGGIVYAAATAAIPTSLPTICTISPAVNTNQCLDVCCASLDSGAKVQSYAGNNTPAQRYQIIQNSDGTYTFRNINSGKVLDLRNAQASNNGVVWQYASNGSDAQKWFIYDLGDGYKITSKVNQSYCFTIANPQAANGTVLQVSLDTDDISQRFVISAITPTLADGNYVINSASGSLVLDISSASSANGARAQFYSANNTLAQRFNITFDINTGYYKIVNIQSNKPLDIAGANPNVGAITQIYQSNNTFAQRFRIIPNPDGTYQIGLSYNSLVIGANPASAAAVGTAVQAYPWSNTTNLKWQFTPSTVCNDGLFVVRSALGTVLDAQSNGTTNGTRLWAYTANGSFAQKYQLSQLIGDYYRLDCINSDLTVSLQNGKIVLAADQGLDSQQWRLVPAGNGRFYLLNKQTGQALDVTYASSAPGTYVQPFSFNNTAAQQWSFESTTLLRDGYYYNFQTTDGGYLNISNSAKTNGARAILAAGNKDTSTIWIAKTINSTISALLNYNSGLALDINSSLTVDGTLLQQWSYYGTGNQRFTLVAVGGGWFVLQSNLGTYVTAASGQPGEFLVTTATLDNALRFRVQIAANPRPYYGSYIDINLSTQRLMVIQDGYLVFQCDCVTGRPSMPTPTGIFYIQAKGRNVNLRGPDWNSYVQYWMPFISSTHGIHDAYWQSSFGLARWQAGYGSHGCVNVSLANAATIYNLIYVGYEVRIHY